MRHLIIVAFVLAIAAPSAGAAEQRDGDVVIADVGAVQRLTMTDGARLYGASKQFSNKRSGS